MVVVVGRAGAVGVEEGDSPGEGGSVIVEEEEPDFVRGIWLERDFEGECELVGFREVGEDGLEGWGMDGGRVGGVAVDGMLEGGGCFRRGGSVLEGVCSVGEGTVEECLELLDSPVKTSWGVEMDFCLGMEPQPGIMLAEVFHLAGMCDFLLENRLQSGDDLSFFEKRCIGIAVAFAEEIELEDVLGTVKLEVERIGQSNVSDSFGGVQEI